MKKRKDVKSEVAQQKIGVGASLEVSIERILPGGMGLAHAAGRTILVGLAAPGDRLRVSIGRVRGSVAFATIKEIIEPSPARVEPPCPYFGRCGGCDFQQLNYDAQLSAKVEIIRDCMRRITRVEISAEEIPITASPIAWHYRTRAQWQLDAVNNRLGYFERGTHNVCDVAECPVIVPALQETLGSLREGMNANALPPDANEFQGVAGDEGASLAPPVDESTTREVTRRIGDFRYRFSAEGFFQINQELLPALINAAIKDLSGDVAVDLYCGVGLFTLPLALRFNRVAGVEANTQAISYARRNQQEAELDNITFEAASVGEWLGQNARKLAPVDLVLLDPPRTGIETGLVEGILDIRPCRISYVSCDPATLARDLKPLLAGGYRIDSLAAFDMFPQTHHVETVVHLSAGD